MVSQEIWQSFLAGLDQVNVDRGLFPYFRYHTSGSDHYDYANLDAFVLPFTTELLEPDLFNLGSHLMICINGPLTQEHERYVRPSVSVDTANVTERIEHLKERRRSKRKGTLNIEGLDGYEFDLDDRVVLEGPSQINPRFPILYQALLNTDRAFVFHEQGGRIGLYTYKAYVRSRNDDAEVRLREQAIANGIQESTFTDMNEGQFMTAMQKKLFELVAWPPKGMGTKHLAAANAAVLLDAEDLSVCTLSTSGVYSRTDIQNGNYSTTHMMYQPLSKFRRHLRGRAVPPEFIFKRGAKKMVLYAITFARNSNWGLETPWVDCTGDYFVNPGNVSQRTDFQIGYIEPTKRSRAREVV